MRKQEVTKDFHISSHPLSKFAEVMNPTYGSAIDFLCGTDYELGFLEDLELLQKAIEAERQGKETIEHTIMTDLVEGTEETVELSVADLLSYERCKCLSDAITDGVERMCYITPDSQTDEAEHLRNFAFHNYMNDEPYATVYSYMLTDFKNNKAPKKSVNQILDNI